MLNHIFEYSISATLVPLCVQNVPRNIGKSFLLGTPTWKQPRVSPRTMWCGVGKSFCYFYKEFMYDYYCNNYG